MKFVSTIKTTLIFSLMLSLAACGSQTPALPDDPNNEPVAESIPQGETVAPSVAAPTVQVPPPESSEREAILKLYDYVDPDRIVPDAKLEEALLYYHKSKSTLKNPSVLSVLDFAQSSTKKRFYIINMTTGKVWNLHVAHGKGSDSNHDGIAEKFSNVSGSNASSLGFYKTAETYQGSNGYSLRLDGLSSTNSNARARAVVIHGASYVQDTDVIQGRSWGCPAVSTVNHKKLIDLIKGGSLIYAAK